MRRCYPAIMPKSIAATRFKRTPAARLYRILIFPCYCAAMTRHYRVKIALGILILGVFGSARAQMRRGITPEDYFSFQFVSDPQFSPDGASIAYELTTVDSKKNRRDSSIWLVPADGSDMPRRLSAEGFELSCAALEPGRQDFSNSLLANFRLFKQRTSQSADLFAAHDWRRGGSCHHETEERGRELSVVAGWVSHRCGERFWSPDKVAPADRKSDVRHYTHIQFNYNDTGWYDDKRQHLWVVNVASGDAKQITDGQDWNDADPQWSPDGTRIAFVSDRTGKLFDEGRNTDVWTIPAGGGSLTRISDHDFADESPRWSADGKRILFTGKTAYHQFFKLYVAASSGSSPSEKVLGTWTLFPWNCIGHGPMKSSL